MKEIEDFLGQGFAHAGNRGKVGQAGPRHGPGGTEMLQQSALAPSPNARDFVQGIGPDGGTALFAVAADHKAVGLVAQPLQIIQDRALGIEAEGLLTGQIEMLAAGIAVGALGNGGQRDILDPKAKGPA